MEVMFSVLIPAFKAKYLKECIDSVLNQTYNRFEIIILNDASPENIDSIVHDYTDERIKYYVNKINIGAINVVHNWNKCLSYAQGDYVICMGDDDCLKSNCLEVYNSLIQKNPGIGLLHGWTEIINDSSDVYLMTTHRCERESAISLLWHRLFAYKAQFIGDFCFNREVLVKGGGFYYFPLAWGSDEITAVIAAEGGGVINTQEVVFQYRRSPLTITQSGNITEKLLAVNQKIDWIKHCLATPCFDKIDDLYRREILCYLPHYEEKMKGNLLISDIKKHSVLRGFYWINHRKKYRISRKTVLYAILRSLA